MLIKGLVVKGFGEGRLTGYPTANLKLSTDSDLAEPGVYAGTVFFKNQKYHGLLVVGVYKADNNQPRHEVYIIDWSEDIYGCHLEFEVLKKIRDIEKLSSQLEFIKKIKSDIAIVEGLFI